MRIILLATFIVCSLFSNAQPTFVSQNFGTLNFKELDHGLARIERDREEKLNTPSGTHGWLNDFEIVLVTDSIRAVHKATFGVVYQVDAKDTVDIDIDIEWIYPQTIINDKGQKFTSIRYTTKRPTNIPSASSYTLDEPYETVKGKWQMNLYIEDKKVYARTFTLY